LPDCRIAGVPGCRFAGTPRATPGYTEYSFSHSLFIAYS
jgi:hypothetical protein